MAYREQRDMSGILFRNEDKISGDPATEKFSDATGRATVDGVQYWVSAWTKLDRNGNKFQSLSFKRMDSQEHQQDSGDQRRPAPPPQRRGPAKPQPQQDQAPDIKDSDIPF